jgi:hypothetical protein
MLPFTLWGRRPPPPSALSYPGYRRGKTAGGVILLEKNLRLNRSCGGGGLLWKTHSCTLHCTTVSIIKNGEILIAENFDKDVTSISPQRFSTILTAFSETAENNPSKYIAILLADRKFNLV